MPDFDPHAPIPGTSRGMTDEEGRAWARKLTENIVVSAARNTPTGGRFVFVSDDERKAIAGCSGWGEDHLSDVLDKWDAAPADPVEAVFAKIADATCLNDGDDEGVEWCRDAAEAALRALGGFPLETT